MKVPGGVRGGGITATIPIALENHGQADAFGIVIDVSAGNGELPLVRRRFVRDIPEGGRVDIPVSVPLQLSYGWAVVLPLPGTHNGMLELDFEPPFKVIFINRNAAPADVVRGICQGTTGGPSC